MPAAHNGRAPAARAPLLPAAAQAAFEPSIGIAALPPRLVHGHGDRIGQVERADVSAHGDAHALPVMLRQQRFGQAGRLFAEYEKVAFAVADVAVRSGGLCGKKGERGLRVFREQLFDAVVIGDVAARLRYLSLTSNPSGRTRCRLQPVAAQVRAMLPVFCGISGSTRTMLNMALSSGARPPRPDRSGGGRTRAKKIEFFSKPT